jgi:hypothetical protein
LPLSKHSFPFLPGIDRSFTTSPFIVFISASLRVLPHLFIYTEINTMAPLSAKNIGCALALAQTVTLAAGTTC